MTDNQPETNETPKRHVGLYFALIGAVLLIVAVMAFGWLQMNASFMTVQGQMKKQTSTLTTDLDALKQTVNTLQAAAQKSQDLSLKQEQLIADWQAAQKNDLNKWYVAEAQYLVKLANDHLQFTHNTVMAMTLLVRADQVLETTQDANVLPIRQSLAENIAALKAAPEVNVTNLYLQLVGLNSQLDQLPLPTNPLSPEQKTVPVATANLPWWQAGLHRSLSLLSQVVIVRNMGDKTLPLIMPDEKIFLLQNLHAQMETVIWAVLHRQPLIYQSSLQQLTHWIEQYFVKDDASAKNVLQSLQALQKVDLTPPKVSLSSTIQLFDQFLSPPASTVQ